MKKIQELKMKLSELIISIGLLIIMVTSFSLCITTIMRNTECIIQHERTCDTIINADYKIRKIINSIHINYWQNNEKQIMEQLRKLDEISIKNIEIKDFSLIKNKDEKIVGVEVDWRTGTKEYKTMELL